MPDPVEVAVLKSIEETGLEPSEILHREQRSSRNPVRSYSEPLRVSERGNDLAVFLSEAVNKNPISIGVDDGRVYFVVSGVRYDIHKNGRGFYVQTPGGHDFQLGQTRVKVGKSLSRLLTSLAPAPDYSLTEDSDYSPTQ